MTKYKVFGAALLATALMAMPAAAQRGPEGGRGAGGQAAATGGGGGAMSRGAVAGGGTRAGATVRGGGSFRGAAVQDGRSFQGGSRISRGEVSRGGDHFAGGRGFRGERRDHFGRFGLGVAAGVGLGYYGYDNGYYDDGDYGAAYAYEGGDDGVAYCMQRYRSYDPGSGTFLGYDGFRHPCP